MQRNRRPSPQAITVLRALAAQPGVWRHGYELSQEVGLKAGSLYPILIRLSDRGLLESSWEVDPAPGRPARHLYRLTTAGADVVGELADSAQPERSSPGRAAATALQPRGAW